ncbi:MAG TPA: 2,3-bisphosphoglycerate-independent phosphoglycerate mutase [Candidatus Hydrogenedentes bacterium]|jgi:2,3-bisphosphoglycerate-independent phosphoglycerate mutase|nr:2,3-bisphosphoglycerate-independent phosphoglycerate mutase [Candidatus Hydrogenedentota bacterium]MDY0032018.1 2,3-bisphosphoglycerate-independent phosphoglycerate mutase [FCB group bacterium]HNZ16939.1 2,3-bisphosphoglycerate-independent phosphoglycerate mutase [Candidatus Hydrogenedentota bacterium]HOH32627.1 2,3-bisphosphoglycerate-independent phosphoglycerate mutase [Candidatus Hydrogenedentota bacterium]HPA04267.1 2,3-bisphosphoglycerate-independent phosphoglycerate mutase [Candidatus 
MSKLSLKKLAKYTPFPGPVVLVIMDGVGIGKRDESDGVHMAYTPVLDELLQEPLYVQLKAHGTAVGLPTDEDMGNSEVGHNALGAGRVFSQGARLVNEAIRSGKIFEGAAWNALKERAASGGAVHFIGLLSDGNVHSHIEQLYALLDRCARDGMPRVRVHPLMDGRDVGEKSALKYIEPLEARLAALSEGGKEYRIASGGGRMITTMDRYFADWTVVERGWKAHVLGEGRPFASASEAIKTYYAEDPGITDQYLESFVIAENGKPVGTIEDGDAVVFFNFRGDRAIEISMAFEQDDFSGFDRKRVPDVFYAGMMEYDGDAHIPRNFLVEPPAIDRTIGQYLCAAGVTSYAISETQKFGHVTYFWNGNNSGYLDETLEKYVEIPSDKVTFDQRPWMKAAEITDAVLAQIRQGDRKFVRLNFANGDMVGHTGIPIAVRIAVEAVDLGLRRILPAVRAARGILIATADHGNADCMWTEKKGKREAMVAHTLNPVPFVVKDFSGANVLSLSGVEHAGLSNVAATLLNLLGYEKPDEYDPSLITVG